MSTEIEHKMKIAQEGNDRYLRCSCGTSLSTYNSADRHIERAKTERLQGTLTEALDLLEEWVAEADGDVGPDLSTCPYFTGDGTCGFGCRTEPECVTCIPVEGWPLQRARALLETARPARSDADRAHA